MQGLYRGNKVLFKGLEIEAQGITLCNKALNACICQTFAREDEVLAHIRQAIPERGLPAITVQPEEGRFLQFLATVCDSHLTLEIGTLGGYSGVWIARGLASGGRLITIEKIPARATVAREHFQLAGVVERVEVCG